jgi:hypothetical protein
MGSSLERKGKGERGRSWGAWHEEGEGLLGALNPCCSVQLLCSCSACCTSEEEEKEEREEKKKSKEKKTKIWKKNSNLKIFGEKTKRQFMKLVKIIFFKRKIYA